MMNRNEYRIMYDIERTYWWFKGKQFLINMLLKMHLEVSEESKLLDIGCGTGIILELLKKYGTGYGVELSSLGIRMLRKRKQRLIVQADANRVIPFKNDIFDAIMCLDVLEHLKNDTGLLKEMLRICKPGGIIIITVPAMMFLWSYHDDALHHKRRYTKAPLVNKMVNLDCRLAKASYFNMIFFLPLLVLRKIKLIFSKTVYSRSDFFISLPSFLNDFLYLFYVAELKILRLTNIPFGASVLLVVKKHLRA